MSMQVCKYILIINKLYIITIMSMQITFSFIIFCKFKIIKLFFIVCLYVYLISNFKHPSRLYLYTTIDNNIMYIGFRSIMVCC